jgi:hypothetical protein
MFAANFDKFRPDIDMEIRHLDQPWSEPWTASAGYTCMYVHDMAWQFRCKTASRRFPNASVMPWDDCMTRRDQFSSLHEGCRIYEDN